MTFNVGDRVRCLRSLGNPPLAQVGEEFQILRIAGNGYLWFVEKGLKHGNYPPQSFELAGPIVDGPIVDGSVVYLVNPARMRRMAPNQRFVVQRVDQNLLLIDGYWMRADRFSQTPPEARPVPPPPRPRARPYEIHNYPGCCGAMIVYFGGGDLNADRVKVTTDGLYYPGYVCVLNSGQYNRGGGKMLEDNGWVLSFVTASNSGKTYPLYHYRFIKTEAYTPPVKVTEAPRVFGK